MSRERINHLIAGIAVGMLLGLLSGSASAQVPVPDTSRVPPADSAGKTRPDSAARAASDSGAVPATTPAAAAPPAVPPDSVLAAACADGGSLAADLLVVLFAATATEADRLELAKVVSGKFAGSADAVRPGAWYLRVPNADLDPTVADRVIRFPTVQEVGPAPCKVR